MNKISLKSSMLSLGINTQEADVYLALVENGPSTSGPLITKTNLHRNVVYTALEHLIAQKYVTESQVRGKKHFAITDPETFTQTFSQKAEIAQRVAKDVAEFAKQEPQEITLHEGNEEYLALLTGLLRNLPVGATKYVLGTGGETFMSQTMRPIWRKYHTVAKARDIHIKMIAYESQRAAIATDTKKEGIYEVRYLSDEIENPAGTHIYPEASVILNIIYSTESHPVTAIRIRNKSLAQSHITLFENLWKIAKT